MKAEGEEAFRRKVQYLSDFGKTVGIPDVDAQVLSQVMLTVLDERWKDHLYDLDQLRNAIQYRAWGQKDPLVEYKREAFEMFEDLIRDIQSTFTERFLKVQITQEPPPPPQPRPVPTPTASTDDLFTGRGATAVADAPAAVMTSAGPAGQRGALPEVGRNDPCPCGSGKKYKKCHGAGK